MYAHTSASVRSRILPMYWAIKPSSHLKRRRGPMFASEASRSPFPLCRRRGEEMQGTLLVR